MSAVTKSKGLGNLSGRGLLAGALGGLIMIAVLVNPATVGRSWYFWILIAYFLFGLPCGLLIGGVIGLAIWLIHNQTAAPLGPVVRVIIGSLVAIVFWALFFRLKDPIEYAATSWQWYLTAVFMFGGIMGTVTGLLVGSPVLVSHEKGPKTPIMDSPTQTR